MQDIKFNDKVISLVDLFVATKHSELLLKEVIFQLILNRENDREKANDKFNVAMDNVAKELVQYFNDLPVV